MYLIIQLVVFFSILPIDVNRKRKFLIPANEIGAPENPKLLKMLNPKNNKFYGSIYVLGAPSMDYKTLAFGKDNAAIVKRTFSDADFNFNNGTLTINTSANYTEDSHFSKDDFPIIRFEQNASKATKFEGHRGRGITIRTVPSKGFNNRTERANLLIIDYKDLDLEE